MAYFRRLSDACFQATEHTGGAWNTAEQHIAPALGLLAHCVESDRDRRGSDHLSIGRLSYDILGTVPVGPVDTEVQVLRPGRTIELVQATMSHGGRAVVSMRAWLMQASDTAAIAGSPIPGIGTPEDLPPWDMSALWAGGYIASAEVRRKELDTGRAISWVRLRQPLLADEPVSRLASAAAVFDISNGLAVRVPPTEVSYPNLDLTVHLFREPATEWIGFDTTVSFGGRGVGLTDTVLYDGDGPIGAVSQILTVRPG